MIKVDYTAPKLSASYYKKGTDSVTATGSTVYIKNQNGGTNFVLYGNYNDGSNQSGVKALVFKKNGDAFTPIVTYSATAIENGTIPDDSTYAAYNNTAAAGYNSWKATFSLNETARITVEGEDNAGNKATPVSAIDVTFDNTNPVLSNLNFTETKGGVTKDVYSSGSGNTLKYFTNNSAAAGRTFKISGIATDNIGIQSVSLDVEKNPTTSPATKLETQTINEPNGNWEFDITGWSDWTGATAKVTVKDKAGNTVSKELNISFDTTDPVISELKLNNLVLASNADTSNTWYKSQIIPLSVKAETQTGDSGIASVEYATQKSGETEELSWTAVTTKDTDGNYVGSAIFEAIGTGQKLYIRVTDNAGNLSYFKTNNTAVTINIDTTAPTVIPPENNTFSTNGKGPAITVTGTASDAESGLVSVVVTVDGLDFSQTISSFTGSGAEKTWIATIPATSFTTGTAGNFTIYATATNKAGITSSLVSVGAISVDSAAPVVEITSPADNTTKIGVNKLIIGGTANDGTGTGLSNETIKVYYTKDETAGTADSITSLDTTKWTKIGEISSAAAWTFANGNIIDSITYPGTIVPDNANTELYFTIAVTDKAGNTGYSVPRKIIVDRKLPEIDTEPSGFTGSDAWINSNTIALKGSFKDPVTGSGETAIPGSGINTIYYLVGDTFANAKTIPTTDGNYDTNIQLNTNGSEVNIHIWAKDNAGNVIESLPVANSANYRKYTISVDSKAPIIESKYFAKGTGTLTATSDSAYVTGSSTITLYGNYADGADESGVNALTFKNNGTEFTPTSILYSTTQITGTNGTVPADSEYGTYSSSSAKAYKSWKAVFTVNAASRITVEGSDIAGNPVSETVLDIKLDTKAPVVEITSPADNTTKVGAKNFILGGTASDGTGSGIASGMTDVYYTTKADISGITTIPNGGTAPSTITTGTKADEAWVSLGQVNSGAAWTFTQSSIESIANDNVNTDIYFTVEIADKAGNVGYAVPRKVTIDRKKPSLKSGTGKINGKTNTSAWFNNRTINLEGTFEDDASGVKYVYYKVGDVEQQLPSDGTYNRNITLGENVNSTTIEIWAEDNAGNKITNEDTNDYQSYTLRIDTTAPVIELESQGIQYSNRHSEYPLTVSVSDPTTNDSGDTINASGVDTVVLSSDAVTETSITCELDEEDGKYKAEDIRALLPNTGNATITIVATDNAGNTRSKTTTIMVDTKEPTVTLDQPTNAKGTGSETYVNGVLSLSGTSYDDNIIDQIAGLCYMVEPAEEPTKPSKAYITSIDPETEEVIWPAPTGWTKLDGLAMTYGSNTSKWTFQGLDTNTTEFNDKTVYFTAAVIDKAGNIGYSTPVKVIVDQDSNRPTIKITSMLLDGMTSDNRKGSTESEITGSVSDDDGVPRGLKYSTDGINFTTNNLVYSTSDGTFTITMVDGEHDIYFEVETNEEVTTGVYKKFTTKASPTATELNDTPKLTDRNGTTFGEKGENTNKNTVYYMYIDKEQPEVKDFKYSRTYDAETWDTSISGEYFGGPSTSDLPEGVEAKNIFYITQTAKDANGVKKVYLSIPADALDGNSNAVTSWFYQSGSVKKTIYTIGNHPSDSASYWNDFAAVSGTKTGDITSVAANNTSVTITTENGTETYNRTAYIFALADTEPTKDKKVYHIWKTPEDKPIDVTGLASGGKTASLIAYDGTRQTAESKIIWVDNSAPAITISAPETVSSSAVVNGSINDGTNTSVTTVSFAVTKTDVTNASTIQAELWESESHAGATQFKITFDGSEEEDSFETHAHLLKQYLINRGILTQNDINTKSAAARQLQPVNVWIRSVDNCNNVGYQKQLVYVDALGNIPTVSIAYPTLNAQDQTLGGTITIMGSSKDNIAPKYVWLQFDINGDEEWTTADYNLLKAKYTFGNMKYNSELASSAEVSEDDIADVGIKVDVDGSFSWSKDIDSTDLFKLSSQTANTITMWAYASDDDNGNGTDINVSRPDTRVFNIDKDNPYFKQDTIKLVQYSEQENPDSPVVRELPYTEAMYIKGIWWIEGEVRDNSAGIKEIKKSVFGNNNQYGSDEVIISSTGTSSTTEDYRFESNEETGENNTTIYNYNFKIKVGATTTSGRNRFKIKVKENKPGTDARDAEKEFILYYDNIKPTLATPTNSSDGIATEVKNDNGFYGMHSVAYEANANDSGIERVAVYFTRTIGDDTYIFDPMYKRGVTVSNNDVSKIKITDSLVQDTTGDKLYWGSATAADTNGLDGVKVTLTAAVPSYVHVGGLAKIDDFVYRIQKISDDKETVTLSSAPNALPSDKKVYFAVANVVDNTKEEKKPASATILKTDYGYGYASNFSEDDSDKIMEYLKNVDSTTWNWNLYINSKNIPDGAITIHYVIFDKAGNTAYNSVNASVENNKPRLVGVTIGRDVNQDGSIATTSPETITYYENGTAAADKPTLYKNGATTITIPNKITVKSKMEVTPEIVGGNGKIYYKIKKKGDSDYVGYGTSSAAIELMDGNNAYDNAEWDNNKDHTDTSGALVTQSTTITHDLTASNKVRYQALISQNDSAWSLSYMLYDSKEAGEVNKVYINIPEIDFAVYDEEAPSVTITPFYWKQDGDIKKSSAVYKDVNNKTVARGHIELKADLSDIDTFTSTGVYDDDDKVSGIIKIEGTATDTRKLSALYISVPGMEPYFGSTNANLTKKTVNSVDYYQISTYSGSAWTDKVGDLANYGFAFQTSDNSLTDTGHTVNWKFTWDTSKISTITAADVNIKVLVEDAASEASTNGQNKTAVGPLKVDVVPYITGISTELSKGNKNYPTVLSRSALGLYPVRRGSDITIEGFNFTGKNTDISINGTSIVDGKKTAVKVDNTNIDDTSKLIVKLDNTSLTSGGVVATVGTVSSLNNETSKTVGYNSEANGQNNDTLTDKRELHFVDVTTTTDTEDKRNLDMAISGNTINFSAGYKDSYFSTMIGANGTSIGTVNNLRNSYTRYFDNAIAMNDDGTPFTVSACGDTLGTPVTGWNNGPSHFALTRGGVGTAWEYSDGASDNGKKIFLDSNWNGSGLNNLDRFKWPDIVVTGSNTATKGYISYYDTTQKLIKFRYFTSNGTKTANNFDSHKAGDSTTGITEGAVNTNTTYSQGYTAIAGANENSPYSAVGVTGTTALVAWYDTTSGALKLKYNDKPAESFSGYQEFKTDLPVETKYNKLNDTTYTFTYYNNQYGFYAQTGANMNGQYIKSGTNYYKLEYTDVYGNNYFYKINGYNSQNDIRNTLIYTKERDANFSFDLSVDGQSKGNISMNVQKFGDAGDMAHEIAYQLNLELSNGKGAYAEVDPKTNRITVRSMQTGTGSKIDISNLKQGDTDLAAATYLNTPVNGAGSAWSEKIIDRESAGQYVAMKTDKKGGIHFAYYDTANGDLKYAYLSSVEADPVITTVDSYQQVGQYIDLALKENTAGTQVTPYISYYSMSNADTTRAAKVAKLASPIAYTGTTPNTSVITNGVNSADKFTGAWEAFHVPTKGKPVQYRVNIGVKSNGEVYISYLDDRTIEYVKVD